MLQRLLLRSGGSVLGEVAEAVVGRTGATSWHCLLLPPCPHRSTGIDGSMACSSVHARGLHSSSGASLQHSTLSQAPGEASPVQREQEEPTTPPRVHLFLSQTQHWHGPREGSEQAATHTASNPRLIYFPNLTLQMLPLPPDQLQQLKEHGWVREVAFKTTPNVTKLEIKAYLESVYGMSVERVHTINYLGRKFAVRPMKPRAAKKLANVVMREDDWKKAYVIFKNPPASLPPPPPPPAPESPLDMLATLRRIKLDRGTITGAHRRRRPHICPRTGQVLFGPPELQVEGIQDIRAFPQLGKKEEAPQSQSQDSQQPAAASDSQQSSPPGPGAP